MTKGGGVQRTDFEMAADIIRDAGGRIVGRTRLQKIGYLLELAGLGDGFSFEYRHYGPYSEELATATRNAQFFDLIKEEEVPASWGGYYSIFKAETSPGRTAAPARIALTREAVDADPIELELAATAAFIASEGHSDPWAETERRKPEKARGHLSNAKALYRRLLGVSTPKPLPKIV